MYVLTSQLEKHLFLSSYEVAYTHFHHFSRVLYIQGWLDSKERHLFQKLLEFVHLNGWPKLNIAWGTEAIPVCRQRCMAQNISQNYQNVLAAKTINHNGFSEYICLLHVELSLANWKFKNSKDNNDHNNCQCAWTASVCRALFTCFTYLILVTVCILVWISSPFYRRGNWGTERFTFQSRPAEIPFGVDHCLPKVTCWDPGSLPSFPKFISNTPAPLCGMPHFFSIIWCVLFCLKGIIVLQKARTLWDCFLGM